MYAVFLSLLVVLLIHPSHSVVVTFVGRDPSDAIISQICSDGNGRYADICCEPLDLDVTGNRNYGWFKAAEVSFTSVGSPSTFIAIYDRSTLPVCSGPMLDHNIGDGDWKFNVKRGSVGSVAVRTSLVPASVQLRTPHLILVGGLLYKYVMEAEGIFMFRSGNGQDLWGRYFQGQISASNISSTNQSTLEKGMPSNQTVLQERSADIPI